MNACGKISDIHDDRNFVDFCRFKTTIHKLHINISSSVTSTYT